MIDSSCACWRQRTTAQGEIAAHLRDDVAGHRFSSHGKRRDQGVVGYDADRSRESAGTLVNQDDGLTREHLRPDASGRSNTAGEIPRRFGLCERPQLAARRDPLPQLPDRFVIQQGREFRLPGKDDRQQLGIVVLDVAQQP